MANWVSHGIDASLYDSLFTGFIARFFIENQSVSMPNFGSLPDSDIQLLADYVIALNQLGKLDAEGIRQYSDRTKAR